MINDVYDTVRLCTVLRVYCVSQPVGAAYLLNLYVTGRCDALPTMLAETSQTPSAEARLGAIVNIY